MAGGGEGEGELSDSRDAVELGIALNDVQNKRTADAFTRLFFGFLLTLTHLRFPSFCHYYKAK